MAANRSSSNMSSSNNNDDDRRLKQAVEVELTSDDEEQEWSSDRSRRSVLASLRDLAESMMKREVVELEMIKAREAARIQAENRRLEMETQLTEMMLNTQLQIASFLSTPTSHHKRKRGEEDGSSHSPVSLQREGAMLLSLLQFNLGI